MKPLEPPDIFYVRAAEGWIELGNHGEAVHELNQVRPEFSAHPDVMEVHWQMAARESRWDDCRDIARGVTERNPESPLGWIHFAYATRRATGGGLDAAREILIIAHKKFPAVPLIPYNLACYECQLRNLEAARQWLKQAFSLVADPKPMKLMAVNDPDLEPIRGQINLI